jgi:hypothetical protein
MSLSNPCDELTLLGDALPLKWKEVGARLCSDEILEIFLGQGVFKLIEIRSSRNFSDPEKGSVIVEIFIFPGICNTR